eukprot:TRINITY_DN23743_c0_g1_i1.p1 TRINITY_DN23743_c0_g1~~TRINITY_DN23743_c0_g1_i1.p1  ORF type:complete len:101 (-),score=8.50 TRINITY_DN23743_c0_g1_i1:197-499(-)
MARSSRAADYIRRLAVLVAVWLVIVGTSGYVIESPRLFEISLHLPFVLLVWLGGYALFSVGRDIAFFRDCPESAFKSLQKEISDAKVGLKSLGVNLDATG